MNKIAQLSALSTQQLHEIDVVSQILPFKTNNYVTEELIDWNNFENDPMFILNFPQHGMLKESHFDRLSSLIKKEAKKEEIDKYINHVRLQMNPHPAGQMEHNVPTMSGKKLIGIQHKYRETMLFFPSQGQTCHAYCTFCFRWPQFSGMDNLKFGMKQTRLMIKYLKQNKEITDILITGGDPMVMKANILARYLDAIIKAKIPHIKTIRIGTKSLSFWPYRFLTDPDSTELLDSFKRISDAGIHLAVMAHFNHPRELGTEAVKEAVNHIRSTGAQIRTQSPLLGHINNNAAIWAEMWRTQVDMGIIPYYMFVARDTGAHSYFSISLQEALNVFNGAYRDVSGICRTVRGPSMSAGPGKIHVTGIATIKGEKVFVLNFIQGRDPEWVGQPFFAKYDPDAHWITDLVPAFGEKDFFYEKSYIRLLKEDKLPESNLLEEDLQSA
ncbi:KamA family radical SAM protein [Bacteroidota bacterium]